MPDYRSTEAQAYHHLYKTAAWVNGRAIFLKQNPLCQRCLDAHRMSDATIVHHIKRHRGDPALFFSVLNWQAVCAPCHDGIIKAEERRGYLKGSVNGRARDPLHPWNRPRTS